MRYAFFGGESGRELRRSFLVLTALVGGVLAVAASGSIAGAQIQIAPVAVAVIGAVTVDPDTEVATAELDGSGSFDPDPGGSIASHRWEVVTEAYQWLEIDNGDEATASFEVPSLALVARYGPFIEFRLTVADSGSPSATATASVVFSANRRPTAVVTVSAKLPALRGEQFDGYDDDGDGVVDENSERYTREGVIDGPGENGNADYEWDIREGALLVVDGSGSFDADGPLPASAFSWVRLYASDITDVTDSLPVITQEQKALSTDEDPEVPGSVSSETIARLPFVSGRTTDPYYLYYVLTVTDEDEFSASQLVKIVIRDAHDDPVVEIKAPEISRSSIFASDRQGEVLDAGEDRYVIPPEVAENGVALTAVGTGDGGTRTRELVHTWSGVGVVPSESNGPGSRSEAEFTAPPGTEVGDSFVVEVEVVDPDGLRGAASIELVIAVTVAPFAVAPEDIETNDGIDGGFPVADPPTGIVVLRGFGFDADGDEITYQWEQVSNASGVELPPRWTGVRLVLSGATNPITGFRIPAVPSGSSYMVYVQFKVTDIWGVSNTDVVKITVLDGDDDLRALPGLDQRVSPGSLAIMRGGFHSGRVSDDAADEVTYEWVYKGIETHPRTEHRSPSSAGEILQGYARGEWFPDADGTYSPTAGGRLKNADKSFAYFDAPELGEFNSVKLVFALTVGVGIDDHTDTLTVVLVKESDGGFFSGDIDHPDFCMGRSLGGPLTYPLDSDGDGVADVCSLQETRRAAVARLTAWEKLAVLNQTAFSGALFGVPDDPGTEDVDESTAGTCASAPTDLGDTKQELAHDACGRAAKDPDADIEVSPLPDPVDAAHARVFYSGVINSSKFCTGYSLGGPIAYAYDSDGDGVADVCALPYTRREAVARINALEAAFANHPQLKPALAAACAALGTLDFGDPPEALATDACNPNSSNPDRGTPLPTPS